MRSGSIAIGLAALVGSAHPCLGQAPQALVGNQSAVAKLDAKEPQMGSIGKSGVFVAVPTGKAWIGPEVVDGEPRYARRVKVTEGMTMVEVSTAPFAQLHEGPLARPDKQPASW